MLRNRFGTFLHKLHQCIPQIILRLFVERRFCFHQLHELGVIHVGKIINRADICLIQYAKQRIDKHLPLLLIHLADPRF